MDREVVTFALIALLGATTGSREDDAPAEEQYMREVEISRPFASAPTSIGKWEICTMNKLKGSK